jgi:predicted NBD/HSP70 family sugar kinase
MSSNAIFARPVLCVDIGGTSTKAGVLHRHGTLESVDPIPTTPSLESYFRRIVALIRSMRALAPDAAGLGISVAGFLDDARTRLIYNPNPGVFCA